MKPYKNRLLFLTITFVCAGCFPSLKGKGSTSALNTSSTSGTSITSFVNYITGLTLLNINSSGTQSNVVNYASISGDGRYVVYATSSAMVAGDVNGQQDIYRRDLLTNTTILVSVDSASAQSNGASDYPSVSYDGNYVVFRSAATNLVAGDTNGQQDIFMRDISGGITTRVNVSSASAQATGAGSNWPNISRDGRYVMFTSTASNLVAGDTNGQEDVFVRDTFANTTERINTDSLGAEATGNWSSISERYTISTDGRYAVFESYATNLIAGDTNTRCDIFMKDRTTGALVRVNTNQSGTQLTGGDSTHSGISSDGRYVSFASNANVTAFGEGAGNSGGFVKDMVTGDVYRVTYDSLGAVVGGPLYGLSMSEDARIFVFGSESTSFVTGDTNGMRDVFARDRISGTTIRLSVTSAGVQGNGGSAMAGVSVVARDGRTAVFSTDGTNFITVDANAGGRDFYINFTQP